MPGSLLSPPRTRVVRNESTRSDHSDGSNTSQSSAAGKKVSFSKAVRVKKYARPKKSEGSVNGDLNPGGNGVSGSPEKRFWFKVYKNKHRQAPDPKELRNNGVIYYDNNHGESVRYNGDGDGISYHPNPSPLNYPTLTNECATQTPPREPRSSSGSYGSEPIELHPSQMPIEPPHVRRNHVKKIVNRFNEEAVFQRQRSSEGDMSPPGSPIGSPRHHSTPVRTQRIPTPPPEPPTSYSSRFKKNPIVNGVKVMFGMGQLKKKDKQNNFNVRNGGDNNDHHRYTFSDDGFTSGRYTPDSRTRISSKYPYKSEIRVSDGSDTEVKSPHPLEYPDNRKTTYGELVPKSRGGLFRRAEDTNGSYDDYFYEGDEQDRRRGKYHVETFDSGNQLLFDTTDVNTSSTKLEKGELFSTVGEKHQLWQNNKRIIVYEEPSPRIIRRKAKSQSDLSNSQDDQLKKDKTDKCISTDYLSSPYQYDDATPKKTKDSWLKLWRTSTRDKGVQCDKIPTIEEIRGQDIFSTGKYKILKPRTGVATAYSNVPPLEKVHLKGGRTESNHTDEYNASVLSSSYRNGDIYSQVDKSKKKRNDKKKHFFSDDRKNGSLFKSRSEPLYIGPPPKEYRNGDNQEHIFYEDDGERTIKTSKRSFGFRLRPGSSERDRKSKMKPVYREENWYDVDDDIDEAENHKSRGGFKNRDKSMSRQDLGEEEFISDLSSGGENVRNGECPSSVMREVDYKKREISYENVPRSEGESHANANASMGSSGLWFRDADEDYRKEMAQSEVSYPAGNHVGSERFYTISRTDKAGKQKPPTSPRAYTLDRRHFKEKKLGENPSGVKILVNGKEVSDGTSYKKNKLRKSRISGEDPSSVQSDPLYVRGGLAAAYQARQRAAVRRSNSTAAGMGSTYRTVSPVVRRRYRGTSEASGASSETETAHSRKPLIMYIPGISHPERSPIEGDRSSGINVARSQSMMTSSRPSRIVPKSKTKAHHKSSSKQDLYRNTDLYEEDEIMPLASEVSKKKPPKVPYDSKKNGDIKRRHSMPKDTKFSWLKWKIRGKPSREP